MPLNWMARNARSVYRRFGWTFVRSVGEVGILTRVSILALILVPVLAGVWPAVRVAVNRYNAAINEAAERFDAAAQRLETSTQIDSENSALDEITVEMRQWAEGWRDRFGAMTADEPYMSPSLALAFFAAACVTIGQLIYQISAPSRLRRQGRDAFVEWMHNRYPEGAPDRDDGLRRATDALAAMAEMRPDQHPNFVKHHGETVWIPPKQRIDWFTDPPEPPPEAAQGSKEGASPTNDNEASQAGEQENQTESHDEEREEEMKAEPRAGPEGILPGAERARLALEEGARAEDWLTGRRRLPWAWISYGLYLAVVILLMTILVIQCQRVGKAAGWWGREQASAEPAGQVES